MKNNKKKKIILLIVIVVLLSLTARGALVYFEAKDVIKHYTDYRTETLNLYKNLNDCYNSEHSNSVEKAFYLSHQNLKVYEQDPLSVDLGFYSTVKNQKGESLAFSQPYILFEKIRVGQIQIFVFSNWVMSLQKNIMILGLTVSAMFIIVVPFAVWKMFPVTVKEIKIKLPPPCT
ncbi:MAG: hypothetical protein J6D06_04605 [Clostridia bacterium]|nr:hypothetical protein [Clostridia bacterium]